MKIGSGGGGGGGLLSSAFVSVSILSSAIGAIGKEQLEEMKFVDSFIFFV